MFGFGKPQKYEAVDRHYALAKRIASAKTDATLIKLCIEDISLVDKFNKEYKQKAETETEKAGLSGLKKREYTQLPKSYPSFKKLAIIYERQKKYVEAIEVCKKAIRSGYPDDGTEKGMRGRIEKLKAKL